MSLPHSRLSCFDMLVMAVLDQKLYTILMSAIYFSMMMEICNEMMLEIQNAILVILSGILETLNARWVIWSDIYVDLILNLQTLPFFHCKNFCKWKVTLHVHSHTYQDSSPSSNCILSHKLSMFNSLSYTESISAAQQHDKHGRYIGAPARDFDEICEVTQFSRSGHSIHSRKIIMFYRFSNLAGRVVSSSQLSAYRPQVLFKENFFKIRFHKLRVKSIQITYSNTKQDCPPFFFQCTKQIVSHPSAIIVSIFTV